MTSIRDLYERAIAGPDYPPDAGDLGDVKPIGLAVPIRASAAVLVATALIVADHQRLLSPADGAVGIAGLEPVTIQRLVLFLAVPLGVVVLAFRDSPGRYAFRFGDWRWGLAMLAAGLIVMTPIILALAQLPQFRR